MTKRPADYLDCALLLRIAGFFHERGVDAYVVGGTVRDWLLGRSSQDLDLAVAGDALSLTRALADELGGAYVPLDIERATARAVLRQPGPQSPYVYIDVARLRGDTLTEDLADRDFTINAMAVRLADAARGAPKVIDPLRGQDDLRTGRLRAPAASAFQNDPLRLLRAIRLAAELGFTIEPRTRRWIAERAGAIRAPAPERVRDEIVRLFACHGTADYLRLMDQLGLLARLLPELTACSGVVQPARHQWDAFEHMLVAVERLEHVYGVVWGEMPEAAGGADLPEADSRSGLPAYGQVAERLRPFGALLGAHLESALVGGRQRFVLLKLLTLLHDVGKAETWSVDEADEVHFYRHEQVGADLVAGILRRLRFGAQEVRIGRTVTVHHMRPKWLTASEKVTTRAIYRFFRDTRDSGVDVVLLSLADTLAQGEQLPHGPDWRRHLDITYELLRAWFDSRSSLVEPPVLVRGSELIETFALEPGPVVGELLEAIREAQVARHVSTREEAMAFAERWLAEDEGQSRSIAD